MGKAKPRLRRLVDELARLRPDLDDPEAHVRAGRIEVGGIVHVNPATLVRVGASIVVRGETSLRGEAKLEGALAAFVIDVSGCVALDVGAAAGGFTRVLLRSGARRVYAVDAGHGQLLGSLRQDARVVNLERTNLGALTRELVPEPVELLTIDVSYLALQVALPQLDTIAFAPGAHAIALVKPQFELGRATPPRDAGDFEAALERASTGFRRAGWAVEEAVESPVRGARGSTEFLLHARRRGWDNP